ncbi:probable Chorismate synthase [Cephalotrichum gorgonifer]|uniref:chorismate synthase n=1 Tax=Cephalotrichum gorgonifer TaxID=2041049 RepID=A0AAE8MZK5_9PEZI|nr:probable Chorismate synthase [Cephalotrichum gorgonifer]
MSTFGTIFKVTTFGESHGLAVGCIIDNPPPGLSLTESDIQPQLNRRRPGQSAITTPRDEKDQVVIQSGTEFGKTLGTPISLVVRNEDQRPKDYGNKTMDLYPRPSHADFTYLEKYGIKASSGGGRSSARETIARVAAGAVAEKFLKESYGIEIVAFVTSVGGEELYPETEQYPCRSQNPDFTALLSRITREEVDSFLPVRCPDADANKRMEELITRLRDAENSTGGTVTCVVRNVPSGLGEPAFDKLEAIIGHAMMSIPAVKAFEIGSGFGGTKMLGSDHNDPFVAEAAAAVADPASTGGAIPRPKLRTQTNHSGGVQGGISNGQDIYFRVGFKPPATIGKDQTTATYDGSAQGVLAAKGRHDPCVVPRAVPIVEGMAALAIMDALCIQQSRFAMRGLRRE